MSIERLLCRRKHNVGSAATAPLLPASVRLARLISVLRSTAVLTLWGLVICGCILGNRALAQAPGNSQDEAAAPSSPNASPVTPLPFPADTIPADIKPDLAIPAVPDSYVIGKNDLLSIFVYQMNDLTTMTRVDSNGNIHLPLLPSAVFAAGKTSPELAKEIEQQLVQAQLAVRPQVKVVVRQVMSRPIIVSGAVRIPTVIQAARPLSLLEVISRAGGPTRQAGAMLTITDRNGATRTLSLEQVLDGSNATYNPVLTGGESVRILPGRLVYAVGALERPGAFPLETGEPITVLKAIALAQGFSRSLPPDRAHAEVIRTTANGERQEVPVNLDALLKHQIPDPTLQPGDILYVPESNKHKILAAILSDVGQTAVIGLGYNITHF